MNSVPTIDFIRETVNGLVDFVKPTYGPSAKKVVIHNGHSVMVLDDGVSIAKEYQVEDKQKNAILDLVKEVAEKTNSRVGDGTTGSLILLQAILNRVEPGTDLTKALSEAKEHLKAQTKKITSEEELFEISKMAYKDEVVAKMIASLIFKLGPDASVSLEESPNLVTTSEIKEGLQIDTGFVSGYMMTDLDNLQAVWEKCPVLVTDRKIKNANEVVPLIDSLMSQKITQLAIFADDFLGDSIATFVSNKLKGGFQVLAIKMPSYGDRKRELMEDICSSVGGSVFPKDTEDSFNVATLGYAEKIIADKDTTTIISSDKTKDRVAKRISIIKSQLDKETNEFDKYTLTKRMARLGGGVAIIKVGANTASEMKAIKYKIEDAINATKVALESGAVLGGGVTLSQIKTSSSVLNEALLMPMQVLKDNGGELSEVWDPVEVIIASLESAVSIASLLLSLCGIITKNNA
jgi:chaperonin GroEL